MRLFDRDGSHARRGSKTPLVMKDIFADKMGRDRIET